MNILMNKIYSSLVLTQAVNQSEGAIGLGEARLHWFWSFSSTNNHSKPQNVPK